MPIYFESCGVAGVHDGMIDPTSTMPAGKRSYPHG